MNDKPMTGDERFSLNGTPIPVTVLDFWRWMGSELNDNLTRAALGEFLVASALQGDCEDEMRAGWRKYDLLTNYGCRIEVKTSAYRQEWKQNCPSAITFDIAKKRDWEAKDRAVLRHADVYVFCVFNNAEPEASPLDLSRWDFYVVSAEELNRSFGDQKTASLSSLKKHLPMAAASFVGLSAMIRETCSLLRDP